MLEAENGSYVFGLPEDQSNGTKDVCLMVDVPHDKARIEDCRMCGFDGEGNITLRILSPSLCHLPLKYCAGMKYLKKDLIGFSFSLHRSCGHKHL